MKWYLKVIRQYTDFEGRARRKEYWMFVLFNSLFALVAIVLDNVLRITISRDIFYGPFYILYALATFLPNLAVAIRRLHDIGKNGWWFLINLIPIVGPIWFLVLMVTDSDHGENEFGQNPKNHHVEPPEIKTITPSPIIIKDVVRDNLVLIVVAWMLIARLFWVVFPRIISNLYATQWFEATSRFMNLIWAFVPFTLAFAVKDKTKQLILFILGGIYFIIELVEIVLRSNY